MTDKASGIAACFLPPRAPGDLLPHQKSKARKEAEVLSIMAEGGSSSFAVKDLSHIALRARLLGSTGFPNRYGDLRYGRSQEAIQTRQQEESNS